MTTPEVSRAAARVVNIMALEPDSRPYQTLMAAAETARTVDQLPNWARVALAADDEAAKQQTFNDFADRMTGDGEGVTVTQPPGPTPN